MKKDYTAAKLADMVDASHLMILTSKEQMETADGQAIGKISVSDVISLIDENHFDAITTLPKLMPAYLSFPPVRDEPLLLQSLRTLIRGLRRESGRLLSSGLCISVIF